MTLSKSFFLLGPQFHHPQNEDNNNFYLIGFSLGINCILCINTLQYLTHLEISQMVMVVTWVMRKRRMGPGGCKEKQVGEKERGMSRDSAFLPLSRAEEVATALFIC